MPDSTPIQQHVGWQARLALDFAYRGGRTVLAARRHQGPLVVQKPFYPEGSPCHCYLLHPPGGIVGGDELTIDVDVGQKAHSLLTTPAAGKFYRSDGRQAKLKQRFKVADSAVLEWLPQETIFFSGCDARTSTRFDLQPTAALVAWEISCLGRPASRDLFDRGLCVQKMELWRNEKPLYLERGSYAGGSDALSAKWGLANFSVSGTMLVTPADQDTLECARAIGHRFESMQLSASLLGDVLVCRFLGHQGEHARHSFTDVWNAIRPSLVNRPASKPRIWAT